MGLPNLLTWLRAVEERIDRRAPEGKVRLGLLPAIGEQKLHHDVEGLFKAFRAQVADERTLANYSLHVAKVPNPSTPTGQLQEDGTILVPIPDPPDVFFVYVFDEFTYDKGRDMRSFANEALAATEELMEGLLGAFERACERVTIARG